ncbi:MAG: hypothetical protein DA407_02545 [Bacteroidetes bacterium]|nr:MAG: hypothetical protein DA407_02545 [Bacteroidota bacterium]
MIKFFRKIRYNLMETGKTGKYFKYAIGEIVLVVIGILIALQINNWNEERKTNIEERELLTNLSTEFTRKLNELEIKNADRSTNVIGINKLLHNISNRDEKLSEAEMLPILAGLQIWFAVNEEFSIIDMLFSSGKINTISNDSLKTKLISWPDKMEEMLEEQRALQELVIQSINPLIITYVSQTTMINFLQLPKILEETYAQSPHNNDYNGLLDSRNFESLIGLKKVYLLQNIRDSQELISDAQRILELINNQLHND